MSADRDFDLQALRVKLLEVRDRLKAANDVALTLASRSTDTSVAGQLAQEAIARARRAPVGIALPARPARPSARS